MTPSDLLPFERSFREWVIKRGITWKRLSLPIATGGEPTTSAYRFTPPDAAARTVIALHGAGNDALFAWIGLFKRLLLEGAQILTFDLPGHGRQNRTRFGPEAAAEATRQALDLCAQEFGGAPIHAIGVSLGGSVLVRTLPELQDSLASAAVVVAPLQIRLTLRSLAREVGPRTLALLWREREHYGLTGLIPSFGSFKREIYPLQLATEPPPGTFGYVHALNDMLRLMKIEEAASRIRIPTLLVYGARDRVVPLEQGRTLHGAMTAAELLEVRGGTHLSTPLDEVTVSRLARWLREAEP